MEQRIITTEMLKEFKQSQRENERSEVTIAKYQHDIESFVLFANGCPIDKSLTIVQCVAQQVQTHLQPEM